MRRSKTRPCQTTISLARYRRHCSRGKLQRIFADNNNFSGTLPVNLGDCFLLTDLVLQNNSFSSNFPTKIWLLPQLTVVFLNNNNFTGTLPDELSFNVYRIEIGDNMFYGSVPASATGLRVFNAKNNRFDGELPIDMSKLANLTDLVLPGNRITGTIPKSIELLQNLVRLDLSGNRISGVVP
ncbi:hypothetical protein PR202_gb14327 [Eleusine coracana subsp. coracana]|uniref:Uncharacterized protein n=1 Tax=Eleusine coracana subsp. coracana TaxID=191504 RepID=A0AAV5EW08_ELECO|nr:hypothetical protein PR202_gb14327 [Eleusine coracana subsp. coracana]